MGPNQRLGFFKMNRKVRFVTGCAFLHTRVSTLTLIGPEKVCNLKNRNARAYL